MARFKVRKESLSFGPSCISINGTRYDSCRLQGIYLISLTWCKYRKTHGRFWLTINESNGEITMVTEGVSIGTDKWMKTGVETYSLDRSLLAVESINFSQMKWQPVWKHRVHLVPQRWPLAARAWGISAHVLGSITKGHYLNEVFLNIRRNVKSMSTQESDLERVLDKGIL